MKNICRNQQGFTLAELLVALTIFAIGLLAVAGMQVTAIRTNSRSNTMTVATSMAQRVMEDILSRDPINPFFVTPGSDETYDLDRDSAATTVSVEGAGSYSATYSVTPDTPVANVTQITVTVNGGNRTVTLTGFKRAI